MLVVRDADDGRHVPVLIADLGVRGILKAQTVALLDIIVIDTHAATYAN